MPHRVAVARPPGGAIAADARNLARRLVERALLSYPVMPAIELIGWGSSLVLFATLVRQIVQQWQADSDEGVSPWLFIGQMTASAGFTLYSALIGSWVFVVTNVVLALASLVGLVMLQLHRTRRPA